MKLLIVITVVLVILALVVEWRRKKNHVPDQEMDEMIQREEAENQGKSLVSGEKMSSDEANNEFLAKRTGEKRFY